MERRGLLAAYNRQEKMAYDAADRKSGG